VARATTATAIIVAAWAAAGCGGGGGTPEETVETFNGNMAVKNFELAASMVYCSEWSDLPEAEIERRRAEYAEPLAKLYDDEGLDYGRGEIGERKRVSADEVEFVVTYPLRSRPTGPPAACKVTVREVGGRWYCEPPRRPER
jgi:ABC-type transporter MlaC component